MNSFFSSVLSKKRAMLIFFPMVFLYATSYFQRTAIPGTIFNELSSEYGFTAIQIAGMGTAFVWIYSICQLVVGILADKYCGTRVVAWGGLVFCTGVMLFPLFCGNLWMMYAFRTLTGLGASAMFLSLVKEMDRLFGRANYSVMIGIVYFIGYSGGLFGTLPFERLISRFHWNTVLLWMGVVSVVCYLLFLAGKHVNPLPPPSSAKISPRPFFVFSKKGYVWILLYCSSVNFGIYYIIQTVFGKKFLEDFAGMNSESAAWVILSLTLVSMSTLLLGGIFIRMNHNRRRPQMLVAGVVAFLNTIMMYCAIRFRWPAAVFAAGYLIYAFASGMAVAFSMTCQEINSRDTMAQAAGFLNMANYMAVAVFSLLIGKLLDTFVSAKEIVAGKATIYPPEAYQTLFAVLLIPTAISLFLIFLIPETGGHYLHQKMFSETKQAHKPE